MMATKIIRKALVNTVADKYVRKVQLQEQPNIMTIDYSEVAKNRPEYLEDVEYKIDNIQYLYDTTKVNYNKLTYTWYGAIALRLTDWTLTKTERLVDNKLNLTINALNENELPASIKITNIYRFHDFIKLTYIFAQGFIL